MSVHCPPSHDISISRRLRHRDRLLVKIKTCLPTTCMLTFPRLCVIALADLYCLCCSACSAKYRRECMLSNRCMTSVTVVAWLTCGVTARSSADKGMMGAYRPHTMALQCSGNGMVLGMPPHHMGAPVSPHHLLPPWMPTFPRMPYQGKRNVPLGRRPAQQAMQLLPFCHS